MKTYTVKILPHSEIHWDTVEKAQVNEYPWGDSEHGYDTYAQMVYAKTGDTAEGMYIRLVCHEANPVSIYTQHNDPVCMDSCLECFFSMKAVGKPETGYVNIECNSNGTTLIGLGVERHGRVAIVDMGIEPFPVTLTKHADRWEVVEFVPLSALTKMFGVEHVDESVAMTGNFYKCDENAGAPFATWTHIVAPEPDFHRPEQFGKLILKA